MNIVDANVTQGRFERVADLHVGVGHAEERRDIVRIARDRAVAQREARVAILQCGPEGVVERMAGHATSITSAARISADVATAVERCPQRSTREQADQTPAHKRFQRIDANQRTNLHGDLPTRR